MLGDAPLGGAPLGAGSSGTGPKTLYAETGRFFVVGNEETGGPVYVASTSPGSFVISGSATISQPVRIMPAERGVFVLAYSAMGNEHHVLPAETGMFSAIVPTDWTFHLGYSMPAQLGAFPVKAPPLTFVWDHILLASPRAIVLQGTATLAENRKLIASPAAFPVTGYDGFLGYGIFMSAGVGQFALAGSAQLRAGRILPAAPATYTLTGQPAAVTPLHKVVAARGNFLIGTPDAQLARGRVMRNTTVGTFALLGGSVSARVGRTLSAGRGTFSLFGNASVARNRMLQASPASFPVTGMSVSFNSKYRPLNAQTGAFNLVGGFAQFFQTRRMVLDQGTFSLFASSTSLSYSGAVPIQPGRRWRLDTYMAVAGQGGFLVDMPPRNGIECETGVFNVDSDQGLVARVAILSTGAFSVGHLE